MFRSPRRLWAALAAGAAAVSFAPAALAGPAACDTRVNNTHAKLAECITLAGVREHQAALQKIADANHGTRVSGSSGYDASVDYVVQRLEAAGYTPDVQPFVFTTFVSLAPAIVERVSPAPAGPVTNAILSYSGGGDVTAPVTALPGPPVDQTPGCDAADFAGFPVGNVALVSRGGCTFATKAQNAYDAGAAAVVIANNAAGDLNGTLGEGFALDIPVTSVTQAVGAELAGASGLTLHVVTSTFRGNATTYNVLAETRSGNDSNVVMAGAHLDSVNAGPGINDNGSGSAALLEVAEQMAKVAPVNTVRFAWWGAEESSLVGSTRYVTRPDRRAAQPHRALPQLRHGRVTEPGLLRLRRRRLRRHRRRARPERVRPHREDLRGLLRPARRAVQGNRLQRSLRLRPVHHGRHPVGWPVHRRRGSQDGRGGRHLGWHRGPALRPLLPPGLRPVGNVDLHALDVNSDAMGYAILQYAMNTSDINGIPGQGSFPPPTPTP